MELHTVVKVAQQFTKNAPNAFRSTGIHAGKCHPVTRLFVPLTTLHRPLAYLYICLIPMQMDAL
jgi:hypothetical protein